MKMVNRSLTAVVAAVVLLSGCGPAADDPATSLGSSGSGPSSADAAQTPAPTTTPTTPLSPVVAPVGTVGPTTPVKSGTPKLASAGT